MSASSVLVHRPSFGLPSAGARRTGVAMCQPRASCVGSCIACWPSMSCIGPCAHHRACPACQAANIVHWPHVMLCKPPGRASWRCCWQILCAFMGMPSHPLLQSAVIFFLFRLLLAVVALDASANYPCLRDIESTISQPRCQIHNNDFGTSCWGSNPPIRSCKSYEITISGKRDKQHNKQKNMKN